MIEKQCNQCGKTKPGVAFTKNRTKRGGLTGWCKACSTIYRRKWRELHPEYDAKWKKAHPECGVKWREANRERLSECSRSWNRNNADRCRANHLKWLNANREKAYTHSRKWKKANPDNGHQHAALRRARKSGGTGGKVKRSVVYDRDYGLCHICGRAVFHDSWHLDHIIPLSKGGEHSYRNVAVSHPGCNMCKGAA